MSDTSLVKETLDFYKQEDYGDVVKIIDEAVRGAFNESIKAGEDVRGRVYINAGAKGSEEDVNLVTYACTGGGLNCWYDAMYVYCPNGYSLRKINIEVYVKDINAVGYGRIALTIGRRIAKRINEAIASSPLRECAYQATIRWAILNIPVAFSQNSIYRIAEEIGITDYGLIDKTLEEMYEDRDISKDGDNVFRRVIKT